MSSFLPVNSSTIPAPSRMEDVTASNTPRPHTSPSKSLADSNTKSHDLAPSSAQQPPSPASTGDETTVADDEPDREPSDNEHDAEEPAPPSKKKKGQRFFCTDFPPCQLSFTRSEHLARHIRKHTGERPFQCHCSRRFSRLDNLRQHAQTVHVNEDIPGDSLAATGTRFQRQIRTDRVRPPQGRARAGTTGSAGHARGHSRNLSTSSIASTASTMSQASDLRRRPPPLIMANDGSARAQLSLSAMPEPTTPPSQIRSSISGPSPGNSYPAFSAGGGVGPHYASPLSAASHAGFWDARGHARRLSVPSGPNPFTNHDTYPPPYMSSMHASSYTPGSSVYASPTSSSFAPSRDEGISPSEAELRRRTWHPSTYQPRPATSGLVKYEESASSNTLRLPTFGSGNSDGQHTRLPGIESFDKVIQGRPLTPPLRKPSPMQVDTPSRGPATQAYTPGFGGQPPASRPPPPLSGPGHRRAQGSWDLHYNLTGLNLGSGSSHPAYKEVTTPWGQQTLGEIHSVGSRPMSSGQPFTPQNTQRYSLQTASTPGSHVTRTSPEDSSSSEGVATPSTVSMEYHPAIVHSNGHVEPAMGQETAHSGYPASNRPGMLDSSAGPSGMGRLEALVAVATSEGKTAARLF